MTVFKTYMKIVKSNIVLVTLYTVIFLIIAVIMTNVSGSKGTASFQEEKVKIQIINNDENSSLVEGLTDVLAQKNEIVKLGKDKESIQDGLFFRKVEYVVKIPNNFTKDFNEGKDVKIGKIQINRSFSAYYMDSLINKYLDTWKIYKDNNPNLNDEGIREKVAEDLKNETKTILFDNSRNTSILDNMDVYFNTAAYALLGSVLFGISVCMTVLTQDKIRQRNLCSPVKPKIISFNIILGNSILSFAIFAVMAVAAVIFFKKDMFTSHGLLLIVNLFIITLSCMFLGMIIGAVIKSRSAISAVSTTVTLGLSFISGVFIPQSFLGESVKLIASFNPVYWFVKGNNDIVNITHFNFDKLKPVLSSFSIELAFAICMLAIYLVINKEKIKRREV